MKSKAITLLAVVAVALFAAGGASAAALSDSTELAPENESDGGDATVGVCVVGADSPCNGEGAEELPSKDTESNESDGPDGQILLPEDQNRDGEIDERFTGENGSDEAVHPDPISEPIDHTHPTRHTGEESDDKGTDGAIDHTHPTPHTGEEIGDDGSSDGVEVWIPEDQNRDGQIDDRFTEDAREIAGALLSGLLGLF
ncbi:hypothetical protein [Halovenus sp. HT40]|uniref:hypothetical protein n=1 Tax=Halovenus sp. HT40 TaxID=3126691 RepID=UPI00300ECBC6